jgi:polar amino acid transport system permease protein
MTEYDWNFGLIWEYRAYFGRGLLVTLKLMALTIVFAIPFGLAVALLRMRTQWFPRAMGAAIVDVTRAVPPLVWVVWGYYCLPVITGITLSGMTTVVMALALYTGVFFAEIFRSGLQAVDRGQIEAAYAGGMNSLQVLRRITGPIAFLRVLPPFTSQCVLVIKNTSLASFVAIPELLYEGQRLSVFSFRPMELLTFVAVCYCAFILPLSALANKLDNKVRLRYFGR